MANLEWYRSFAAVYRLGTVTAAARSLYITQPGLSQHVAALERATGAPLFVRTARRMVPTEHGRALYAQVVEALDRLEGVERRFRTPPAGEAPRVRLGGPHEYLHQRALPRLAGVPMRLWVRLGEPAALLEAVTAGELDLVISTRPVDGRDYESASLGEERFWLVGPPSTEAPAPGEPVWTQEYHDWLAAQPWLSYGQELPIIRRFWRERFGRRPPVEPVLVVPSLLTLAEAVARGAGLTLLPDYIAGPGVDDGRLRLLPGGADAARNRLFLAWRKVDRARPELLAVRERLAGNVDGTELVDSM